jgi:hypothetical protein
MVSPAAAYSNTHAVGWPKLLRMNTSSMWTEQTNQTEPNNIQTEPIIGAIYGVATGNVERNDFQLLSAR